MFFQTTFNLTFHCKLQKNIFLNQRKMWSAHFFQKRNYIITQNFELNYEVYIWYDQWYESAKYV